MTVCTQATAGQPLRATFKTLCRGPRLLEHAEVSQEWPAVVISRGAAGVHLRDAADLTQRWEAGWETTMETDSSMAKYSRQSLLSGDYSGKVKSTTNEILLQLCKDTDIINRYEDPLELTNGIGRSEVRLSPSPMPRGMQGPYWLIVTVFLFPQSAIGTSFHEIDD